MLLEDIFHIQLVMKPGSANERVTKVFHPLMVHQIFSNGENIYYYKDVEVCLMYSAHQLYYTIVIKRCGIQLTKGPLYNKLMKKVTKWFHSPLTEKQFLKVVKIEQPSKYYGKPIYLFKRDEEKYFLTKVVTKSYVHKEFQERFESMMVFFVDRFSQIDVHDPKWTFFYIYHILKGLHRSYVPVGVATVYNDNGFIIVSQMLILPNYQRYGLGTTLLEIIYENYKDDIRCKYIEVEKPCAEFTIMRDKLDLRLTFDDPFFSKVKLINKNYIDYSYEAIRKHAKLSNEQIKRLRYIIALFYGQFDDEYQENFKKVFIKDLYEHYFQLYAEGGDAAQKAEKFLQEEKFKNKHLNKEFNKFVKSVRVQLQWCRKLCLRYKKDI